MSQPHNLEAESMLDVYIHDYLLKRKLNASSKTFQAEAQVPTNVTAIDAPRGFLFEWWAIFWDTFIDRYKRQDPVRKDPPNASVMKNNVQQRFGNNAGLGLGPISSVNLPPIKRYKQASVPTRQDMMSPLENLGVAGSSGPLIGVQGSSGPVNSLPLKGWPLMGLDQLCPALHQQQSSMQSPQQSFQHQLRQQHLLQPRKNIASSSVMDVDPREFQMLSNQNISIGKDGRFKTAVALSDPNDGSKNQTRRKSTQSVSSAGPASSSATASTARPSPSSSGPSTPSTHTTGDIVSLPALLQADCSSKPSYMTEVANQLVHTDHVDDVTLDDNIESLLSHATTVPDVSIGKGFSFSEIGSILASSSDCCHLSSDGKLLVSGGNDNKAKLWCTDSREYKYTLDEHTHAITDIRFSPTIPRIATSSIDKTVRVWDVEYPSYSLRTFVGHPASVMSLDFHPNKDDLVCSSDEIGEIRYWSIKNGGCVRVTKVGAKQVRFQPSLGRYLAAVVGNAVSIIDLETGQTCGHLLKGHTSNVQSVCWDFCGEHLASVSEDLVRVWKIGSGGQQNCIHELSVTGKKFRCAVLHPHYPLLVIGCSQSLELWNMAENKMMTPLEAPICSLAVSEISGLVASAGADNMVKLWK